MVNYVVCGGAYAKMIFHAAKYPHLSLNGVLLAERSIKNNVIQIIDCIPLFHQSLYLLPMLEVALLQIENYAERKNLVIAGYYYASEYFADNCVERAPGGKIADKIQEYFEKACFIVINNRLMTLQQKQPAINFYHKQGSTWVKTNFELECGNLTLESVSSLLMANAMKELIDFDNHLDNPQNDWTNKELNKSLMDIMTMR